MSSQWDNWTLVDNKGEPIIVFRSFISVAIKQEGAVVFEPVEKSSFATYNKTSTPFEANIVLGIEGTVTELQTAIGKLDELVKSTRTFSLVTPAKEFQSLTLERYDYGWSEGKGLNILIVNISLREIKEVDVVYSRSAALDGADAKLIYAADATNDSNASIVDTGMTSARPATSRQKSGLKKVISGVLQ